ncbi:hypothetical protein LCGC14_2553610 [marine sediment metagenome]|uniref:Phage ABA sandwich domain-containing protein n=1 Tax=marine sediment metagenome TaxID=412755 RepID=A0A0F9CYC0_9ZZZZ
MENEELNLKLAKWLGWKLHYQYYDEDKRFPYFIPSGKPWRTHKIDGRPLPNFTESLDDCFKWLMPKLVELGFDNVAVQFTWQKGYYGEGHCAHLFRNHIGKTAYANTPALALCKAVEKLIDGKG